MSLPADFGLETSGLNQLQLYSSADLLGKNQPGTNALLVHASCSHPCTEAKRAGTGRTTELCRSKTYDSPLGVLSTELAANFR